MKKYIILLTSLLLVSACTTNETSSQKEEGSYIRYEIKANCTLLKNYTKESFSLSSDFIGKGNCLAFDSFEINVGELINEPNESPIRNGYEFTGWYKEASCNNLWDFTLDIPESSIYLYAGWKLEEKESYEEPEYVIPSKIDDSISEIFVLDGVMNFSYESDTVFLPNSAFKRLEAKKDDISILLNYRIKTGASLQATYDVSSKKILIHACKDSVEINKEIAVFSSGNSYLINNSTYETKAVNYENESAQIEDYHIMLAGSSSMENWKTSKNDLLPLITYNHGIGGTTVEQWSDALNQRLVYPFNPKLVIYYVGINNVINSKESADVIYQKLETLFNQTHAALPNTKIMYVLMNLIPGYTGYFNVIESVNSQIISFAADKDYLTLINPGEALLKENGLPNQAYFLTDGLHLSLYGYVIWGTIIKNKIIEVLSV